MGLRALEPVEGSDKRGALSTARAPKDGREQDISLSQVQRLLDRIIEAWNPHQIWLFGSRARGDARPTSDWDLLVVVPDDLAEDEFDPVIGWRLQKESGVRADVFPCRASDFREDRSTPNTLSYDVATEGVLLYER